ncbi:MAG: S9 family peptidase [Hyphomonas sp.]|nr:S9 family peptidase [Hyphomonas sp.]|tara:strand:- start:2857 stop:4806 length:1950 start_codon:yes stop_codon:yes gene_type:complete
MRFVAAMMMALILACTGRIASAEVPHPPLEEYGDLPSIRMMDMSPDGKLIGFIRRHDGNDLLAIYNVETGQTEYKIQVSDVSARGIWFADNEHLIISASDRKWLYGYEGDFEYSAAFSYNIKTGDLKPLLRGNRDLWPAQEGLGRIIGYSNKPDHVYMPAYIGKPPADPTKDLLRVSLETGMGGTYKRGTAHTVDWFADADGTVYAREDYNAERDIYTIWTYVNGKREKIYEEESDLIPFSLLGVKADKSGLFFVTSGDNEEGYDEVYEMDFQGNIKPSGLGKSDTDIGAIYKDGNRVVVGVRYTGPVPRYKFFDPEVDASVNDLTEQFPTAAIYLAAWTKDWSKILYLMYGSDTPGTYVLQDRKTGSLSFVADTRLGIPPEAIGQMVAVSYPARDGLTIPAIVTWPAGADMQTASDLPLIVMPHGGPQSHDSVYFDWMAQYFANRGYVVLQPNFRGSSGYGQAFVEAGYGEWGGKMQDDVTDGVKALISQGVADADRVCIVGASYGGYSALAGGAYTSDIYECVVAIAPVADIPLMMKRLRKERERGASSITYWTKFIGGKDGQVDMASVSPANAAENFKAPVLLIHGKHDTVVDIEQSRAMEKALRKAGKDVTLIELDGEDHWLSQGETRIETLKAMSDFVDKHIGE